MMSAPSPKPTAIDRLLEGRRCICGARAALYGLVREGGALYRVMQCSACKLFRALAVKEVR